MEYWRIGEQGELFITLKEEAVNVALEWRRRAAMNMIWAIVRNECLEELEKALLKIGEKGFSVSKVQGMGELREYGYIIFDLVSHIKVEIFASEDRVAKIKDAIVNVAWTGFAGDGLIAVLPVEEFTKIRTAKRPDPPRRKRTRK